MLEAAQAQVTAAGSALRSARDAIQATESRAKEVRDTQAAGATGLGECGQCCWHSCGVGVVLWVCWGQQRQCCGGTGNNEVGAMGALGLMELVPWMH